MKFRGLTALRFSFFGVPQAEVLSPKKECEKLMDSVLPFAEQMLKKKGDFFSFGGALKNTGEIASIAGYDGREHPPSMEIIKLLKQGFVAGLRTGDYTATALVYDVRILVPSTGKKSDAIAVSLNHKSKYSVIVYYPYELKESTLKYGDVFAQKGESDIFP